MIGQNPKLEVLHMNHPPQTLGPVAKSLGLRELWISGSQATSRGTAILKRLPALETLVVFQPEKADDLERIAEVSQLQKVVLMFMNAVGSSPGDKAYASLARLPNIRSIHAGIRAPSPSDEVLLTWAKIPHLRNIGFGFEETYRRYTVDGIKAFRKARPDVELNVDGKDYPATKK
jgi:hypothetical protein